MAAAKRAPSRPCLDCGKKTRRKGSRCQACESGKRNGSTRAWRKLREQILERDGYRCTYVDGNGFRCKRTTDLHVDHRTPLAAGGTDDPSNLQTLCATHNLRKGARTPKARHAAAAVAIQKSRPANRYRCARCGTAPVRMPGTRCPACLPTSLAAQAGKKPKGKR